MTNVFRRILVHGAPRKAILCATLLSALFASSALAQDTAEPQTALDRQLDRLSLSVVGTGQFSTSSNGTNYLNQTVNLVPSNTFGAIVNLRYTVKPYIGLEINYGYARYTENFTINNTAASPTGAVSQILPIQTNANEYSIGYVAHTKELHYGVTPFISAGAGSTAFRPTKGGGLGYLEQARATYYATIGVDSVPFYKYFGFRAIVRENFYLAPDYQTNYIRILQRSTAFEPGFGFYIKF
jgi:hypothetical protein